MHHCKRIVVADPSFYLYTSIPHILFYLCTINESFGNKEINYIHLVLFVWIWYVLWSKLWCLWYYHIPECFFNICEMSSSLLNYCMMLSIIRSFLAIVELLWRPHVQSLLLNNKINRDTFPIGFYCLLIDS